MARGAPWLALFGVYAAAALLLDAGDTARQAPRLLEELRDTPRDMVLAALTTVAFAVAAALARRWAPDPWAARAVAIAAVSPAGFALSTSAAAPAAALLAAGTLGAVLARDHPTRLRALGGAACLALAPWFGVAFAAPAAPVLAALVYWSYRRGRRLYAFLGLEFAGASAVTLGGVDTSLAVGPAAGVGGVAAVLVGAPVLALCALTAFGLARSRREKLSRAIPAWRDAEVAAGLTGAAVLALAAVAVLEPVGPEAGVPLAGALGAWGLRAFPRAGAALAVLSLAATAAVVVLIALGERSGWL